MAEFFNSSLAIRNKGNQEYKKAFGSPPASNFAEVRIGHAEKAQVLYLEASKVASRSGEAVEWLSAKKNLGMICMRLASFKGFQERRTRELVLYQFKESLLHLSDALYHGNEISHDFAWIDEVAFKIRECCDLALAYIQNHSEKNGCEENHGLRCTALGGLLTKSSAKQVLATAIVQSMVADQTIKAAIVADEEKKWPTSFNLACEAERPMVECEAAIKKLPVEYGLYPELTECLRDLHHSRLTYLARSESAKLREIANEMQEHMLFEHEELDMDLLWLCVDHYRASMIAASHSYEGCVSHENEAIAASNLGKLFDKVLKMYTPARVLYLHAIHLADMITHQYGGATFFKYEWYQDAKRGIEEDNTRNDAFDSARVAKQCEAVLLKIKPELDAIAAVVKSCEGRDYSAHALLLHLHAKHPPKTNKCKFDGTTLDKNVSKDVRKAVFLAYSYYHPDRPYNKSAGIEWLIMCTEIVTYLSTYLKNAFSRYNE